MRSDDFGKWKKVYDDFESIRQKYGVKEQLLIQASDDPNHVLVVGQGDLDAIQKFVSSEELKVALGFSNWKNPVERVKR